MPSFARRNLARHFILPTPRRLIAWIISAVSLLILAIILVVTAFASSSAEGLRFVGEAPCRDKLVVVVYGWLKGGFDDWSEYSARAIAEDVNSADWSCAHYDWARGSITLNPRDAAAYARDKAGPNLAADILAARSDYSHIHLIGHSSAAWLISAAAKILAAKTNADIHLTFLDAYVPLGWDEAELGDVNIPGRCYWAEHYYTRDLTMKVTETRLTHAHNVDLTAIDPYFRDHNFPRYWYYATITGKWPPHHPLLQREKLVTATGGTEYGFARSMESSPENWRQSLTLTMSASTAATLHPQ